MTEEKRENRRNWVRILVTYGAAIFLFLVGPLLIGIALYKQTYAEAKDLFLTILPVSSGIISYWFATRSPKKSDKEVS